MRQRQRDRERVRKVRPVRQSRCFRSIAQFGTLQQWQQLGLGREMRERERERERERGAWGLGSTKPRKRELGVA